MAKRFIEIEQRFHVRAIIDVAKGETNEHIRERVMEHLKHSGGAESVIVLGGEITVKKISGKPTEEDEDSFECID